MACSSHEACFKRNDWFPERLKAIKPRETRKKQIRGHENAKEKIVIRAQ